MEESTKQLIQLCIEAPVAVLIGILVIVLFTELKHIDAKIKLQDQERAQADKERTEWEAQKEKENQAKFEQQTELMQKLLDKENDLPVKVHTKEEEEEVNKINDFVRDQIDKLRKDTGANRIGFYTFHNGSYFSGSSIPFAKMSLYSESLDFVSAPVMMLYQNMPQQLMPGVIKEISDDGRYYIDDIEKIRESDSSTYHILTARGTRHALIQGVRDNIKGMYLGFISVEYSTNDPVDSIEKTGVVLSKATQRISGVMQTFASNGLKPAKKEE